MSSKRRIRRNECGSKKRHASQAAAILAIKLTSRGDFNKSPMRPYLCKWCHKWHVGHFDPGAQRKANERRLYER